MVFRPFFIRIGGPGWTADRARGAKFDLRRKSRRLGRYWDMPIGKRRCMIIARG